MEDFMTQRQTKSEHRKKQTDNKLNEPADWTEAIPD